VTKKAYAVEAPPEFHWGAYSASLVLVAGGWGGLSAFSTKTRPPPLSVRGFDLWSFRRQTVLPTSISGYSILFKSGNVAHTHTHTHTHTLHIVRVKIVSWQNKKVANLGLQ